ncbi:MAG: DUF4974 domain-containing protein [Marinifilaceae bacterium]|nr:DUF4974 domain-containing protein [Marinifilaceae bacterium]
MNTNTSKEKNDTSIKQFRDFISNSQQFDKQQFIETIKKDNVLKQDLNRLEDLCDLADIQPDRNRIWWQVQTFIKNKKKKKRIRWSIAATIITSIISIGLWKYLTTEKTTFHSLSSDSKEVQLIMADGSTINIGKITQDTLIQSTTNQIKISPQGELAYSGDSPKGQLLYHTIYVPRGNEYHMVLSEQTEIWLNSESELRFPINFEGHERKVYLKGEAFFKVTKDTLRPFRVNTGKMEIEVLGTSFDIKAYQGTDPLAILVQGSIQVKDSATGKTCILSPGYQAILRNNQLDTCRINTEEATAWKEGRFVFRDMPLAQLTQELERWFDIEIFFENNHLREHRFTGVIKRYNKIEDIGALIEETANVKFHIQGRNVIIQQQK